MTQSIAARIAENRARSLAGRDSERMRLAAMCVPGHAPVWFLHGITGIGKTTLARVAADDLRTSGARVVWIDCRSIPPTRAAFADAVSALLGVDATDTASFSTHVMQSEQPVVLILDEFESFRLLETWLRQEFVPTLPETARIVCVSQLPPSIGWTTSMEWHGLIEVMELGPLDRETTRSIFRQAGFTDTAATTLARLTRGNPLGIQLALSASTNHSEIELAETTVPRTVEALTHRFLDTLPDPENRDVLEAAALVRRVSRPMLAALLPHHDPMVAYRWLSQLPFVDSGADGLGLNDAVQNAIAGHLRTSDPQRFRSLRWSAWNALKGELRTAQHSDLWRLTADLLYLIENPVLREGFFPTNSSTAIVEPAKAADTGEILSIVVRHGGRAAGESISALLDRAPEMFFAVRTLSEPVAGCMAITRSDMLAPDIGQSDPILAVWSSHLRRNPLPNHQRAIFCREAFGAQRGERPSEALAATWIEAKRLYVEMRPALGRTYVVVRDLDLALQSLGDLGFRHVPACDIDLGGIVHHTLVLDFGPESFEGWLGQHLALELAGEDDLLDAASRTLRLDDQQITLSRLEYAVMRYLVDRPNQVVSRDQLLLEVWGIDYAGGSNVVDVVIRALRRKLGDRRAVIQTAHGVGYRYVPPT